MLNGKIIGRSLGILLIMEGICMLTVIPVSLYYSDGHLVPVIISTAITLAAGLLLTQVFKSKNSTLGKREGYLIVTGSWLVFSLFGSLPFILGGAIPSYTDAFFETISGFTTTGASILTDIESLPHGLLYWRSMTQWLGGMGIIVLSLAILPVLRIGSMQLFSAEVPGLKTDKLHPKIRETAKRLWAIYLVFTLTETFLLKLGGMSFFDAINHSFTTMATGGYSTKNASIAAFDSAYIDYVITIFMIIAGTNFSLAYFGLHGRFRKIFTNDEFLFYISFLLVAIALVTAVLHFTAGHETKESIRLAAFQVVSIVTTTGYATADFSAWGPFLVLVIFILMFTGGSAGSTGGGIKMVRLLLLAKNSRQELRRLIHPNAVIPVRLNHKAVSQNTMYNVLAFIVFYFFITGISSIIISAMGYDLSSSFSAVAASLGNIGPGLGKVGPTMNYAHFPIFGKWFLSFLMLLGRLELFTVLVLFTKWFYKN
ncbi:MAG: potassium transporter TrkG [Bacteroidales bacterium]|jgi:trk system potassium uptake protein TrkH|nr:potassium transporter TrkG [Bacteroidales bacterium]